MTSPYANYGYPNPAGGFGDPQFDRDAAASMFDLQTGLKVKELEQQFKLGRDEISARLKIAGQDSKDRRYGIDSQRDSEREKLAHLRDEMERIGIPRMLIEKYVAEKTYEIAQGELSLKRDVFIEESQQARAKLQLDREEMERIGIPRVDIERYVAQQNAEIARGNFGLAQAETTGYYNGQSTLKREQFRSDEEYRRAQAAESARQFNVSQTGYMQQPGQLSAEQQSRYQQIRAADEQARAAGQPGVSVQDRAELAGYEDILSGRGGAGGPGMPTLERERFAADEAERQRRYGLDVGKFGAELASTPDTYFQARRFQGVDVPRLLGGAGAATSDVAGGPTPGVATMGAYLGGYDPYGTAPETQVPAAGGAPVSPAAGPGPAAPGPAALSAAEQSRYTQLVSRQQQLAAAGEPGLSPEDLAELRRYVARGAPAPGGSPTGAAPGTAPLSAQEQARWQQLMARDQEIRASGGPGLEGVDLDEAQRFRARGATFPGPTAAGGASGGYFGPGAAFGSGGAGGYGGQPGSPGAPGSYDEESMASGGYFGPGAAFGAGGGGWGQGGPVGPDDPNRMVGIDDPGYRAPVGDPYAARRAAMGGGGGYAEGRGPAQPGWTPQPISGGTYTPWTPPGGWQPGDQDMTMRAQSGPTASVYGGPAVSASVGPQGYYARPQPTRAPSPYPSQDPRQKQVAALAKALPPSPWDGLNEQDSAALTAMASIYKAGGSQVQGGELERLKASGRYGFMQSAGRLLGYDPKEFESQYQSYRPQQGSSRLAG